MNYTSGLLLSFVLLTSNLGTLADFEDKSDEVGSSSGETKTSGQNDTESGPPDSHEAMNNRELKAIRDKRSYEFLMGLINNNSKFEITKTDAAAANNKPPTKEGEVSASASELLLELLVKIAAHPDHWSKVHNLLERIDADLVASKKIVESMGDARLKIAPISVSKKKELQNSWPTFGDEAIGYVNTAPPGPVPHNKPIYPKTFAYQRVTGRPMYLNKNPKAYIAVSVIAPKRALKPEEDVSLEKELRQLKPWTHDANLKNMEEIRSRWLIQSHLDEKEAP